MLPVKLSDEATIKRCIEGDANAFGLLVGRYQNAVYGLCFHMVGNFADAQDLTQETFVRAYLELAKIRDPSRFAGWLYRITVNVCKLWIRDRKGAHDLPLDAIAQIGEGFAESGSPMEHAEAEELRLSITEAIASLSEKNRLAVTLYYIDGLSYEEIGDFLGVSQSAVKSRLHRARKELKEELISMVEEKFDEHKLPEDFPEKVVQEVVVKLVKMDTESKAPIVILQSRADENQLLPIWVGMFEALAIIQKMEDRPPPRPMTHDLMVNMLKEFDMKVVRVVVTDLKESTFYAIITIQTNGVLKEIDARPSDSIALALRTGAPIFVAKSVLSKSGVSTTGMPDKAGESDSPNIESQIYFGRRNIPVELHQILKKSGISPSSQATVKTTWQVCDEDKEYTIRKEGSKIVVHPPPEPPEKEED